MYLFYEIKCFERCTNKKVLFSRARSLSLFFFFFFFFFANAFATFPRVHVASYVGPSTRVDLEIYMRL